MTASRDPCRPKRYPDLGVLAQVFECPNLHAVIIGLGAWREAVQLALIGRISVIVRHLTVQPLPRTLDRRAAGGRGLAGCEKQDGGTGAQQSIQHGMTPISLSRKICSLAAKPASRICVSRPNQAEKTKSPVSRGRLPGRGRDPSPQRRPSAGLFMKEYVRVLFLCQAIREHRIFRQKH